LDKHLELGAEFFFIPSVRNMQHGDYFTSSACTPQTTVNSATNFRQSTILQLRDFRQQFVGLRSFSRLASCHIKCFIFNVLKSLK